jgi:hypothetical protein
MERHQYVDLGIALGYVLGFGTVTIYLIGLRLWLAHLAFVLAATKAR